MDVLDSKLVSQLRQELRIILLIYHRNKNQHGATIWWKQLNMLKRNVSQVVIILERIAYKNIKNTKELIQLHYLLHRFLKLQVKKMYYDFNGIIALGQFVTLGVVLIGNLSRVFNVYFQVYHALSDDFERLGVRVRNKNQNQNERLINETLEEELGEEIGEEILNATDLSTVPNDLPSKAGVQVKKLPVVSKEEKKSSKKKAKKRFKKSVIDDLFG